MTGSGAQAGGPGDARAGGEGVGRKREREGPPGAARPGDSDSAAGQDAGVRTGRPPWQVVSALALILVAIVVVVVLGQAKKNQPVSTGPLPVATVDQPGAGSAACKALMAALPSSLAGSAARTLEGGGAGIAAWGDPAVILRCGLETPGELTCSANLTQVQGVSWLELRSAGLGSVTYLAADRSVRIAVTIPDDFGTGSATARQSAQLSAVKEVSDVVAATLPVRAPCRAGVLLPTDIR